MVKTTSIFGSYRFLRIYSMAWHFLTFASPSSKLEFVYPPCCGVEERMHAHLLVRFNTWASQRLLNWNPIPRLTRGIDFCIELYKNKIRKVPCYICCVCNRLLYKRSVHIFGKSKYSGQKFFSVKSSFDGKQYVCKTCHLIQTFSINTSVPLLTEFHSITNIQLKT